MIQTLTITPTSLSIRPLVERRKRLTTYTLAAASMTLMISTRTRQNTQAVAATARTGSDGQRISRDHAVSLLRDKSFGSNTANDTGVCVPSCDILFEL